MTNKEKQKKQNKRYQVTSTIVWYRIWAYVYFKQDPHPHTGLFSHPRHIHFQSINCMPFDRICHVAYIKWPVKFVHWICAREKRHWTFLCMKLILWSQSNWIGFTGGALFFISMQNKNINYTFYRKMKAKKIAKKYAFAVVCMSCAHWKWNCIQYKKKFYPENNFDIISLNSRKLAVHCLIMTLISFANNIPFHRKLFHDQ